MAPGLRRGAAALAALAGVYCVTAAKIQLLQWNLHGECFTQCHGHHGPHCDWDYPACRNNSTKYLADLMEGQHAPGGPIDFAGIEQLGDHRFLMEGIPAFGRTFQTCGGEEGFGKYPFDIAVLYYNSFTWQPISKQRGGCMERVWDSPVNNYRAYVMQAFERRDGSNDRVIVVVAHYSHGVWGLANLTQQLQSMMQTIGVEQMILLADTNRECGTPSWQLLHYLYPAAKQAASAQLHRTCCVPHFQHCYDRIIAAQFPGASGLMPTSLPLPEFRVQDWQAPNQHHPIKSRLSYHSKAPEPTPRLV